MICSVCNIKINNANKTKYTHLCKVCCNEFKKTIEQGGKKC